MIVNQSLEQIDWLRHGFFTRQGGFSSGVYQSLNCSFSSVDDHDFIKKNRKLVIDVLNCRKLVTLKQVHGNRVIHIDSQQDYLHCEADAMVTNETGIAIGVLSVDCAPVLFANRKKPLIGIAHSGWQGALKGVTTSVINALCEMGSSKSDLIAVIGPTIQQTSYQIGLDFLQTFEQQSNIPCEHCFLQQGDKYYFNLPLYISSKINAVGVAFIENLGLDTYSYDSTFFSYRRNVQQGMMDYGRQISVITLTD